MQRKGKIQIKEGEAHPIGRGIQEGIHKLGIAMNRETAVHTLNSESRRREGGRAKQNHRFINCRNVLTLFFFLFLLVIMA